MRTALCYGTFDPTTSGHAWLVGRSRAFDPFDRIIVQGPAGRAVPPVYNSSPFDVDNGMKLTTFTEFVAAREGQLMPDRPPASGMIRLNALPATDARRSRLQAKPVRPLAPLKPSLAPVAQVVPQRLVPKVVPPVS